MTLPRTDNDDEDEDEDDDEDDARSTPDNADLAASDGDAEALGEAPARGKPPPDFLTHRSANRFMAAGFRNKAEGVSASVR